MADAPEKVTTPPAVVVRKKRPKWLLAIGITVGLVFIAGGTWAYRVGTALAGKGHNIGDVYKAFANPRSFFPNQDRIVILIAGKDYNHNSKDIQYTTGSRSDTIMLLSADLANAKLSAVSVPRDMRVTAPDGVTGKINGTFARKGMPLLSQTIEQQFGVHPDYTVVLKADAIREIVNALGGVDVDALDNMFYEDAWDDLKIDIPKGHNRLNGDGAIGFVRFRESGDHKYGPNKEIIHVKRVHSLEEGDLRRMARQQQMIHAMLTEVKKPANILNLAHIMDVSFNQVETNLSQTQMEALANIFKNSSGTSVAGTSVPGKDGKVDGTYYWIADIPRAKLLMQWVLYGDPAAGRQFARVVVYGDAKSQSVLREAVDRLKTDGFKVSGGLARKALPPQEEVVYHADAFESMAKEVASDIGAATVRKEFVDPTIYSAPDIKVMLPTPTAPQAPSP